MTNPLDKKPKYKIIRGFNGEEFKTVHREGKWLDADTYEDANGVRHTKDPNMVMRQFHNMMKEDVFFKKMRPDVGGQDIIGVHPDKIVLLPHGYYFIMCKSGSPITGRFFFGKDIIDPLKSKVILVGGN